MILAALATEEAKGVHSSLCSIIETVIVLIDSTLFFKPVKKTNLINFNLFETTCLGISFSTFSGHFN